MEEEKNSKMGHPIGEGGGSWKADLEGGLGIHLIGHLALDLVEARLCVHCSCHSAPFTVSTTHVERDPVVPWAKSTYFMAVQICAT